MSGILFFIFASCHPLSHADIDTDVYPILWVLEWGFKLGGSQFCTSLGLNCIFLIAICGQVNLMGGQFGAMVRFNLLGGQSNLLSGQMPTS